MASRRLDVRVPVHALLQYSAALHAFARSHAATLVALISAAELDLQRLSDLTDQLAAADLAWAAKVREMDIAQGYRDDAFDALLPTYTQIRSLIQIAVNDGGGQEMRTLLDLCPPPSRIPVSAAPVVLARLVEEASTSSDALADASVSAAMVAQLSSQRQALADAIAAFGAVEPKRNEASGLREQARASLVIQARKVEKYLGAALTADTDRSALRSLRANHLPAASRKEASGPVESTG